MKKEPERSCRECAHWKEPPDDPICIECWNYQRWKNFTPKEATNGQQEN